MRVLSFTSNPQDTYAAIGSKVQFTVSTSVAEGITYQWQYRRSATASWTDTTMTGYNTATLTVDATKVRNGYQYRCVITGSKNSKIESKEATLHVSEPMVVTQQPQNAKVALNSNAYFTVTATNVRSYQWQYARKGSTTWQNTSLSGYDTATLCVEALSNRNGYQYRCILQGMDGSEIITDVAVLTIG